MKPFALDTCLCEIPEKAGRRQRHCLCPWRAVDNNGECPLVTPQSAEQIAALCRSFNDAQTDGMEGARDSQDPPPRPLARHLSDADRLRKVIQELMDTEKSYVKVVDDAVGSICSVFLSVVASCVLGESPDQICPGPCHA